MNPNSPVPGERGRHGPTALPLLAAVAALVVAAAAPAGAAEAATSEGRQDDVWGSYLDYAYIYSSAEPDALRQRLADYGREAGVPLERYLAQRSVVPEAAVLDEASVRRDAIGNLLIYRAEGNAEALERAVAAIAKLDERLGRHENRYWHHYIRAHRALARDRTYDFVGEMLELWLKVVVPLEAPYEALETLSLSTSPNSGFVAALPYVYENVARMVLIETQQVGMSEGLDPLGAVVRLLAQGRIGAHPEVVPREASAFDYVERIVERLEGPESDAGSLGFTLALFEAGRYHDSARERLATGGFGPETVEAVSVAAKAYEAALAQAATLQGQAAVYTRVLRQLGEVYVARQRLGIEPDLELPFSIEGAMDVYAELFEAGASDDGWATIGYQRHGREAYVAAMHRLWHEIQETTLNAADTYLARAVAKPQRAPESAASAARLYSRLLDFFDRYTSLPARSLVPDAAYFAAYEAARGFGDAVFVYAKQEPSAEEMNLATVRYRLALGIFPFDTQLWPALAEALSRQGRESDYLALARPLAERFTGSRSVDTWMQAKEPGSKTLATLRKALSEDLVVMVLGFANGAGADELERSAGEIAGRKRKLEARLAQLGSARTRLRESPPASPAGRGSGADPFHLNELREVERGLATTRERIQRADRQLAARKRALPLYRSVLEAGDLAPALRAERDHPIHLLLRRMYHEGAAS